MSWAWVMSFLILLVYLQMKSVSDILKFYIKLSFLIVEITNSNACECILVLPWNAAKFCLFAQNILLFTWRFFTLVLDY